MVPDTLKRQLSFQGVRHRYKLIFALYLNVSLVGRLGFL